MADSLMRRTAVEQLLMQTAPKHEPEVAGAIEHGMDARSRGRDAVMLDLRLATGRVLSFAYVYLVRVDYEPGDTITLRFGRDEITIEGRNLTRLRETLSEHRQRFIQEGMEGEDGLKPEDASHVERILIKDGEEL